MATEETKNSVAGSGASASAQPASYGGFVYLPLIVGWLVPGAGHFVLGKWVRGSLLAASVVGMFATGLAMHGEIGSEIHSILDILGLAGGLGNGVLYLAARAAGWGAAQAQTTVADWGTRFIWVAGLLNVIAAVDAHNLRTGRKS